jgi:hypothetical protein
LKFNFRKERCIEDTVIYMMKCSQSHARTNLPAYLVVDLCFTFLSVKRFCFIEEPTKFLGKKDFKAHAAVCRNDIDMVIA